MIVYLSRQLLNLGLTILVLLLTSGCASYYQKSLAFQEKFVQGDFDAADKVLDKNKKAALDKDRLLYFLQKGVVSQLKGSHEESNEYFEQAYLFAEDHRKNYSLEALSLLSNPTIKPYTGEDHELVLIHYFKAMNFLQTNKYEEALVECRRVNNRLNLLNDRYVNKKNTYKSDAFALNLMGIVYEASGDINNAFIAYRNSYNSYKDGYSKNFATSIPEQLKEDLLRTAYLNGFDDELDIYEQELSQKYVHSQKKGGELILFWHNGMGPVKSEWSLNFFIVKGQGGALAFVNEELGLTIPFPAGSGQNSVSLSDLKFVRVAFPKYLERKTYFRESEVLIDNQKYKLELAENINAIAFKTLEDRMIRELGNSLLRLALKQAAEAQASKQNPNMGALLSVFNAVSEKSDTRNWQTLPYSISYARIPLKNGNNKVLFNAYSPKKSNMKTENFEFSVKDNETIFHLYHSLESIPLGEY